MKGLAWQTGVTLVLLAFCSCVISDPARLLKVPRIYNALITTDEELVPSQAYPAVAPVLRPAYHPLSYVVYGNGEGDVGGSIIQHNSPAFQDGGGQLPNFARVPSLPGQQQQGQVGLPGQQQLGQDGLPGPQQSGQDGLPGQQQQGQGAPPIYSLQAKQRPPVIDDQVKNNRNPEIPDVPPPPLPVRAPGSANSERKPPPNYPPPPSAGIF